MEILDLYDKNRNKIDKTINRTNKAKLNDDEFFIYVQCWIINSKKNILLTRRKLDKENGGTWEATGGCVQKGESSIQAIKRELYEEIGLDISEKDLFLLRTIQEYKKYRNCFRDIYLLRKDIDINDLKFIDGEVIDAKFITIEQFKYMINNNEINSYLSFFIDEYNNI